MKLSFVQKLFFAIFAALFFAHFAVWAEHGTRTGPSEAAVVQASTN